MEKRNPHAPLVGLLIGTATTENNAEVPPQKKIKNRTSEVIQQFHFWVFTRRKKTTTSKWDAYFNVHCSIKIAKIRMQSKCSMMDEWIKKM